MKRLLYVASEKPQYRDPKGYIGAHGNLLDRMLRQAGLSRDDVDVVWAENAGWEPSADYACIVAGGDVAATEVIGWNCRVSSFHGSILPLRAAAPTSYDAYRSWLKEPPKVVVTWDILQLHKNWEWHPQAMRDWHRAGQILRGEYQQPNPDSREWVMNQPWRLEELSAEPLLLFDTELTPNWMIGFASASQVHVCDWDRLAEGPSRDLLQSPTILKAAHNLQHDLAMCDLKFGFEVKPPYFDTYGGATSLNTALERSLSPGIASRFTNWPFHKWLNDVDSMHYNGLDNIVGFDACVEIISQLKKRNLWEVNQHDHRLLEALYDMQRTGFRISEVERAAYELETAEELAYIEDRLMVDAEPIIRSRIHSFQKPHLFREDRQCTCCGGGKQSKLHCWRCGGLPKKPECKADYQPVPGMPSTVAKLKDALPPCSVCQASGKVERWNRFNPGSNDHVADVLYRGLRISPRKNKGVETVAADKIKPLASKHPLIATLVEASELRSSLSTVERLQPDPSDGRVHCVFDPWGTQSGRVASSEGLLRKGTNAQNIPKKARRFVVPDDGCVLLYPDMAQIEARAVAVLSSDEGLRRAFTEPVEWPGHEKHGKIDSHTKVVQMMLQSAGVEITRDQAKRGTYAAIYGVSPKQLAIELTAESMRKGGGVVTELQSTLFLEGFFKTFPGVRRWHQDVERQLIAGRTVRSPSGRERHWPGRIMDGKNAVLRETLKEAWSFVPQEIGAWVLAEGLLEIYHNHRQLLTPLIHVHDAVLFQCKKEDQEKATQVAIDALSRECFGMWFPCEMKAGGNWFEAS